MYSEIDLDYEIIDPVVQALKEQGTAVLSLKHEIVRAGGVAEMYISEIKYLVTHLLDTNLSHQYLEPLDSEAVRLQFRAA